MPQTGIGKRTVNRRELKMKIAVSAQGKDLDANVDPRFGRAPYFIIIDPDTMEYEAVDNKQSLNMPQGAGVQAAMTVINQSAEVLLTGNCGPKAFRAFKAANVDVITGVKGTVKEAVEKFKRGEYKIASAPSVRSHWS